jgi:hypothetical protein
VDDEGLCRLGDLDEGVEVLGFRHGAVLLYLRLKTTDETKMGQFAHQARWAFEVLPAVIFGGVVTRKCTSSRLAGSHRVKLKMPDLCNTSPDGNRR